MSLQSVRLPEPLRRLSGADLPAFQAYRALPELGRYQGWTPMPDAQALAFLQAMAEAPLFTPGAWVQLGIGAVPEGPLLGDLGLYLAPDGRRAEVGFTLAPQAQGRGLATQALRAALALVWARSAAREVQAVTDARNGPSARLLERVGFQRVAERETVFRGEACVEWDYALARPTGGAQPSA